MSLPLEEGVAMSDPTPILPLFFYDFLFVLPLEEGVAMSDPTPILPLYFYDFWFVSLTTDSESKGNISFKTDRTNFYSENQLAMTVT